VGIAIARPQPTQPSLQHASAPHLVAHLSSNNAGNGRRAQLKSGTELKRPWPFSDS
jgi:hypothetical protein